MNQNSIRLLWIPSLLGIVSLLALWMTRQSGMEGVAFLTTVLISAYLFSLTIFWMFEGHWPGVRNAFLMTVLLAGGCITVITLSVGESMFGPPEDGFADNISLPVGIPLEEPNVTTLDFSNITTEIDPFQSALMASLKSPASGPATITADFPNLESLVQHRSDMLADFLAASPAWRVFDERGSRYATRRWKINGKWQYVRHGWYFSREVAAPPEFFTTRFTIGLEGRPWAGNMPGSTRLISGETRDIGSSMANGVVESHCVVSAGPVVIDCFEQSQGNERRLTVASFAYLEAELAPLAKSPTPETIVNLLPGDAVRKGDASLALSGSGGDFNAEIWVNPGEPGSIYLKAFEITKSRPLSARRLKERSNERTGWSANPDQKFLSNTKITIFEGDPGRFYGARFEVWFMPDGGKQERKLLEKNFKIDGWMK